MALARAGHIIGGSGNSFRTMVAGMMTSGRSPFQPDRSINRELERQHRRVAATGTTIPAKAVSFPGNNTMEDHQPVAACPTISDLWQFSGATFRQQSFV